MERPILVVGCPRSGTTLLRDLLRAHSRITIPGESHLLPALARIHGDPPDARAARRLAADLLAVSHVRRWDLTLRPEDLEHHRSFPAMVADVYSAWAATEGKPRWGDKTPGYVNDLPCVRRIFPDAQVVHIVRDPRAVCASMVRRPWGPASIRSAAAMWRRCVQAGRRDAATSGPSDHREVRYEDLVSAPEAVLRDLCAFLGEDFEPQMLRPRRKPLPRRQTHSWREDQESEIVPGAAGQAALSRRDGEIVAWEAGDLMAELGYGSVDPGRGPPPGEGRARWFRDRAKSLVLRLTSWDRRDRAADTILLFRARVRARAARASGRGGRGR